MNRTIGGETLEIELHTGSLESLHIILKDFEKIFPDTIEYYDYYVILNELKVKYFPEN
ncbi:hypothetical protein GF327_03240 [Candidatus Woesearchaeota archaeon]|nr:hypothetical protein [Candidatus Woesearchaeota archaeon]